MALYTIARLSLAAALTAGPVCGRASAPSDVTGSWGGEHVGLEVTDSGATIEYDCATGTIDGPLHPDGAGRFDARGTHVRGHGGPDREGEVPDAHPARYTGRVEGGRMTLTVGETDTGATVGTFSLRRGAAPQVFRCL